MVADVPRLLVSPRAVWQRTAEGSLRLGTEGTHAHTTEQLCKIQVLVSFSKGPNNAADQRRHPSGSTLWVPHCTQHVPPLNLTITGGMARPCFTNQTQLTFGTDAQGGLVGCARQLPPEFLDHSLHLILVPGEFPESQDLHAGQWLIWDKRTVVRP